MAAIAAVFFASSMKSTTSSRRSVSLPMIRSELTLRSRMIVFWLASRLKTLLGLLERRGAAADRLVEVLGVAGEGGAELVDQQRQPLAERLAAACSGRGRSGRSGGSARPGCRGPRRARRRCRRAPRSAAPFGVQSMKYSAISDCGSVEQIVSSPSTATGPAELDLERPRACSELMSSSVTVPGGDARDLDLGAVDQAEGVVELDVIGVRVVAARARGEAGDRRRRSGRR